MKRRVVSLLVAVAAVAFVFVFVLAAAPPRQSAGSDRDAISMRSSVTTVALEGSPQPTYVGKQVCRECHAENFHLHASHGHGSTFADASDPAVASKFVGRSYETERYGTYTYHDDGGKLVAKMPEKFGDESFPLQYALGSGHNAITLLSLIPDPKQGTVGIEHRASWYKKGDLLGPTPGQKHERPDTLAELFGQRHVDRVMHKCVYCHTTRSQIVDAKIVDLVPSVNCEKCHGPGSEHVKQARLMETPPPYSVGRDDWDTESEIQLCGDCHRLPAAISRKELRDYPNHVTRFQPIGMLRSECYLESEGELKCTTCHNPHTTVSAVPKTEHVKNCVKCHLQESADHVACPVSPATGCIECHMPRVKFDDFGISFHDHWIRVHDEP